MAEDRIVKFCAQIGPRSISLVMTNCPPGGRGQSYVIKRCKIEMLTMED